LDSQQQAAAMLQLTHEMQEETQRTGTRHRTLDPLFNMFLDMGGDADGFGNMIVEHIGDPTEFGAMSNDVFLERRRNLEAAIYQLRDSQIVH
jgi:hypothetical protein